MPTGTDRIPDEVSKANEAERRLLASALGLFSEKGYEGTSIREIIERAGVTRPVLYYYFENKEHLFRRLVESWFAELVEDMDRVLDGVEGYRQRLKVLIGNIFEHAEGSPEVVRLIFHTFFAPRHQAPKLDKDALWESRFTRIKGIMQEGIESGDFAACGADTLAMSFCGMMDMHIMTKTNRPHMELSQELGETIVDIFLDGARARALSVEHHR